MTRSDSMDLPEDMALTDDLEIVITRPLVTLRTREEGTGFTHPFEFAIHILTMQLHLFAVHLQMVRNFHHVASIPWRPSFPRLHGAGVGLMLGEERKSVIEIERDGRLGIDLKFGTITFKQEDTGTFAVALVDVLVGQDGTRGTRVQMEVKIPADPEVDSILGVTERCRAHIVATLRGAADTFDSLSNRDLLFHGT